MVTGLHEILRDVFTMWDPVGGRMIWTPSPGKSQVVIGSLNNTDTDPLKKLLDSMCTREVCTALCEKRI